LRGGLQAQLDILEENRTRLESAIATADSAAYMKYGQPSPTPPTIKPDDRRPRPR